MLAAGQIPLPHGFSMGSIGLLKTRQLAFSRVRTLRDMGEREGEEETVQREREEKSAPSRSHSLCNQISGVTSHRFCQILFISIKSVGLADIQWRGLHRSI